MENVVRLVTLSKELGLRLKATSLLPAGLLALAALGLIASGAPSHTPDLGRLVVSATNLGAGYALLLLLGLLLYFVIVSVVLEPLQVSLVRILEGNWGVSRFGRTLSAIGMELHARRYQRLLSIALGELSDQHLDDKLRTAARKKLEASFPAHERLLPTTLGNVLRSVEDRAGQKFGLDTVTVWPLLYPLVSERLTAALDHQRDQIDIAARFCVAFSSNDRNFTFSVDH